MMHVMQTKGLSAVLNFFIFRTKQLLNLTNKRNLIFTVSAFTAEVLSDSLLQYP